MTTIRKNMMYLLLGLLLLCEILVLFFNSGIVKGLNERADYLRRLAIAIRDNATILPGDICDRHGNLIAGTAFENVTKTLADGSEQETIEAVTSYTDVLAYSQVIGYTGIGTVNPDAAESEAMIGGRDAYRLMNFLNTDYWGENGLYKVADVNDSKGQTAVLTLDSGLQLQVFESMLQQMDPSTDMGSAIVMDAKSGEILADVSFPAYDFNHLTEAKAKMLYDEQNTDLEPAYPVANKNPEAPGSILKVLTAAALVDHGMEDFTVINEEFTVSGVWTCEATEYESDTLTVTEGDEIDLETALKTSSNGYFAKAALALGADRLQETAEKFNLKQGSDSLLLDFGNVYYNWDLSGSDDVLAQSGFGQGKTELTTIYAAMMTQAIANDGVMMKPYMVKNLVNSKGKKVYKGQAEVLSQATEAETAKMLAAYMRATAEEACSLHQFTDVAEVFDKYQVAGKTGTAEIGDEAERTNAWYVSFAPANDPKYVVVVNQCKAHKAGSEMMPVVAEIYQYLFEEYKN